jgi:phosphoribosylanthranilate isomerase
MTNKLIKLDRIRSVEEAATVEGLGADLIGVSLGPDPRFYDDRAVTIERAAAIGAALERATLVAAMELKDRDLVMRTVAATRAGLVQPITGAIPTPEVRAALSDAGVGIVYDNLEIAHDDDPGWIFSAYADTPELDSVLFQAEVLPEYREAWAFLRDKAPEYEQEFQIADLNELGRERPLLVGLDFTPDNLHEIIAAIPQVRGIALTIAGKARRGDARFHSYADALRVLRTLGG